MIDSVRRYSWNLCLVTSNRRRPWPGSVTGQRTGSMFGRLLFQPRLGGACHVVAAGWLHTAGSKRSCLGSPRLRLPPATWSQDPYRPLDTGFGIGLLVPLGTRPDCHPGRAGCAQKLVGFDVRGHVAFGRVPCERENTSCSNAAANQLECGPHFAAAAKFPCSAKSLDIKETVVLKL